MDGRHFDDMVRSLSAAGSRRGLLRVLTGLPVAGLLAVVGHAPETVARGRRTHRHHAGAQRHDHDHTRRNDTHSEACIPTGQRCPSRKPRGKHHKTLSCAHCCQGTSHLEADGKRYCGCQPNGGSCTPETASSCCSGFCNGSTCQAAPCSASNPCPQCQTCSTATGLCAAVADGTSCDDGNACTQTDTCQGGVCVGANPVACSPTPPVCHLGPGTCNPATGLCEYPIAPNHTTVCAGVFPTTSVCCNGSCCNGCCDGDGACGACLVFTTSSFHTGNLGGLDGADDICQQRASDGNLPAKTVADAYRAWLSDDSGSPSSRFRRSGRPYQLVGNPIAIVANDWDDLTTCSGGECLAHALDRSETGGPVTFAGVWTATTTSGTLIGSGDCGQWLVGDSSAGATNGISQRTDAAWTEGGGSLCDFINTLFCFQQG